MNVGLATGAAESAGLDHLAHFRVGDAERLPFDDESFDAAVCECAFCTFPDKPTAAAELARVLRPGGRLGLADVVAEPAGLPPELRTLAARVACIADARPLSAYEEILRAHGLSIRHRERHDAALLRMIDQIEARIDLVRLTTSGALEEQGVDLDEAPGVLAAARAAVADRVLGYALLVAEQPAKQSFGHGPAERRAPPG